MSLPGVKISGRGMEVSNSLRSYIDEKLRKHERLFNMATSIDVECFENIAARGVDQDYRVEISMALPKTVVRVEKYGSDLHALVDEVTDILSRKVKRYKEKLRQWEGKDSWKMEENGENNIEDVEFSEDSFVNYVPRIVKRKKIENCTPVSEAEAIERMEMMGYDSFLFKSKKTGNFSLVYRRRHGGYGIVEPCEE